MSQIKSHLNFFLPAVPSDCSTSVRVASDHPVVPFCYDGRRLFIYKFMNNVIVGRGGGGSGGGRDSDKELLD